MERLYFETAPYHELCGCVSVPLNVTEQKALEFATRSGRRDEFMRRKFETDRERSYLANCPDCDTGIAMISEDLESLI